MSGADLRDFAAGSTLQVAAVASCW